MKITEQEVRYVADLANLRLDESEIGRMAKDLDEILTHIDKLNELDTSNVDPMAQVLFDAEETATLREDEERAPLGTDIALKNAAVAGSGVPGPRAGPAAAPVRCAPGRASRRSHGPDRGTGRGRTG